MRKAKQQKRKEKRNKNEQENKNQKGKQTNSSQRRLTKPFRFLTLMIQQPPLGKFSQAGMYE
jgi:hypothetical protein